MAAASVLAVSCSSDDSNDTPPIDNTVYLPLSQGNYWVYDVTSTQEAGQATGRDSLYVANDTVVGSTTYKKLKTQSMANGFFSGALSGNAIRQNGTKLQLTGSTAFAFSEYFPVELSITDFTFFDSAASAGTQLGTTSGTIEQPTEEGYNLSIEYELKATTGETLNSHTVQGGDTYSNVKTVNITLTLTITALFDAGGFTIPFEVLPEQDVVTSTQYYVENIGAVHVSTLIEYNLVDLSGLNVNLPIPQSGTIQQEEVLDTYNVE
ncbi:hypothetical protein SAMN05444144_10467 [Flavobacterium akiainvivens]|nr:hypothetical protein SAMN05444144_10467 [Flavobacterium akiainvivens]